MTPKKTQAPPLQVNCAHCQKPFHFTPQAKAKAGQTDEVEIALECPYCQKPNIVKVPAKLANKEVMFRGGKNQEI